jgi:hypothetical protein
MNRIAWTAFVAILGVIALVVVGLFYFRRQQDLGLRAACMSAVRKVDPATEARRDISRGEDRFFFQTHNGVVLKATADGVGVAQQPFQECEQSIGQKRGRPRPFSEFSSAFRRPGQYCCDQDPPLTDCGMAVDRYVRSYNAEMAKVSPKSVVKYCAKLR